MIDLARELGEKLVRGGRLWLFLDYDGTLAEFAPTPDTILPDRELIGLLSRLAKFPDILRVVIMSGRRFSAIEELLPVPGILKAGAYGVEYKTWQGEQVRLLHYETARPFLDQVKKAWTGLLAGREGFYLEDKGFSLAIHARSATQDESETVLEEAARIARQFIQIDTYHILGDQRFLEIAPLIANKGQSVSSLLKRFPWPGAEVVYIGDDDKDEEAFKVVKLIDGMTILVAAKDRVTAAQYRLESPQEVRNFLRVLCAVLETE